MTVYEQTCVYIYIYIYGLNFNITYNSPVIIALTLNVNTCSYLITLLYYIRCFLVNVFFAWNVLKGFGFQNHRFYTTFPLAFNEINVIVISYITHFNWYRNECSFRCVINGFRCFYALSLIKMKRDGFCLLSLPFHRE